MGQELSKSIGRLKARFRGKLQNAFKLRRFIWADRLKKSQRLNLHLGAANHADRPFVIVCQPSLFDLTRAPQGQHTLWAYCHVPNGSTFDATERIEN